jgi:hypothetical protein
MAGRFRVMRIFKTLVDLGYLILLGLLVYVFWPVIDVLMKMLRWITPG